MNPVETTGSSRTIQTRKPANVDAKKTSFSSVGEKDASSVDSEVARFQDMAEDLQKQLLHAESRLDQVLREKQRLEEQERQDRDAAEQLETLRERFNKTQLQLSFARTLQVNSISFQLIRI